jgi:hypothetical protein
VCVGTDSSGSAHVSVCVWSDAHCWLSHHTERRHMYILKQQQQQQQDYTRCGCRHVAVAGGMALGELLRIQIHSCLFVDVITADGQVQLPGLYCSPCC